MLVDEGARRYIKHYMFDFGSIMGSGTVFAQRHRAGNEYIVEWRPGWLTLATLGLYHKALAAHRLPGGSSVGGTIRGRLVRSGDLAA